MKERMLFVLALVCLTAVPAPAEEPPAQQEGTPNLLVTFVVGRIDDGREVPLKSYEMLLEANGKPAEMMTGARVPIPVTTFKSQGEESGTYAPVTSFTYQNVGFTATVEAYVRPDGRIRFNGQIEDSSMAESSASHGRPIIQTLNQRIRATLEDGVPVCINKVEEAETRSQYIQIQAEILGESQEDVAHHEQ